MSRMITTLNIKKKYFYFLGISFVLSIIISLLINNYLNSQKSLNSVEENSCRNNSIKLVFKYKKFWKPDLNSELHQYVLFLVNDELTSKNNQKNIIFENENIYFRGSENNCKIFMKDLDTNLESLSVNILNKLEDLSEFTDSSSLNFPLQDALLFYSLNKNYLNEDIIAFKIIDNNSKKSTQLIANIIRFLIIFLILNLGFYVINNVKVNIKN